MAPDETHPAFQGEAGGTADGKAKGCVPRSRFGEGSRGNLMLVNEKDDSVHTGLEGRRN